MSDIERRGREQNACTVAGMQARWFLGYAERQLERAINSIANAPKI